MGKRGVGMHAATSAMIRGTSLPRHLRSGAESSGCKTLCFVVGALSIQNPVWTHPTNPATTDNCLPLLCLWPHAATPSVVHASQSVDLSVVMRELSAMRKEMKQAIAHLAASHISPHNWKESVQVRILKYPLHWHVVTAKITGYFGRVNRAVLTCTLHPAPTT